jgi:hypothetical protein
MYLISSREPTRGGPPTWIFGEMLTNSHSKNLPSYKTFLKASNLVGVAVACEWHTESPGSITCREFLD